MADQAGADHQWPVDLARLELDAAAGRLAMEPAASARFVVAYMERETGVDFGDMIGLHDRDRILALANLPEAPQ